MLGLSLTSVPAHIGDALARMLRQYERNCGNARDIRHIEDMPDYLLRDIGIIDRNEIAGLVEGRIDREVEAYERHRAGLILPHAA